MLGIHEQIVCMTCFKSQIETKKEKNIHFPCLIWKSSCLHAWTLYNQMDSPLMIHESCGFMIPVFGRTKYFLGEVVLTYNVMKIHWASAKEKCISSRKRFVQAYSIKEDLKSNVVSCLVGNSHITRCLLLQLNWSHKCHRNNWIRIIHSY